MGALIIAIGSTPRDLLVGLFILAFITCPSSANVSLGSDEKCHASTETQEEKKIEVRTEAKKAEKMEQD